MRGAFTAPGCRRMVRPPPAGAHAPPHARQTTRRHPAGAAGAADALSCSAGTSSPATISDERREGEAALADVLRQLEGHAAPASAWEDDLLSARVPDYEPAMLDKLCAVGRVVWWRPSDSSEAQRSGPIRGTPIVLAERDTLPHWQQAAGATAPRRSAAVEQGPCGARGAAHARRQLLQRPAARRRPARRADRTGVGRAGGAGPRHLRQLRRLARAGDAGRQAQQAPAPPSGPRPDRRRRPLVADAAARARAVDVPGALAEPHVDHIARVLLRRYGVVFRKLLEREDGPAAVARPALRVPPARSPRRGARRPLRQRLLGRAVRIARGRRRAAQGRARREAASACRSRRSIRSTWPASSRRARRCRAWPATACCSKAACRSPCTAGGEVRYLATLDETCAMDARRTC